MEARRRQDGECSNVIEEGGVGKEATWHDNMLQLNRELVLHSMKVTSEVEALTSTNDVLVKKLDSIQKNIKELEEVWSVKKQLLQNQQETNTLLKDQILQLDEFLSLKKAQLHQLKSANLKELEEDAKNRRTAEDIYRTWKRNVEQVARVFEYAPRAQLRTALKQELELQQQHLASLQHDIEMEERRQCQRRALEQSHQQQSIVRLARLMLDYHHIGDVVDKVARATAALRLREQELQAAPKSDNIFSEGVKQIDSMMRAHDLQVSPLKSLHVGFNSDNDDDDDDNEEEVEEAVGGDTELHLDLIDLSMKRQLSSLMLPPSKKLCVRNKEEEEEENEQMVIESSVLVPSSGAPLPNYTSSTLDTNNVVVAVKPSPVKVVDANMEKDQLTSRQPVRPRSVAVGSRQVVPQPSKAEEEEEKKKKTPEQKVKKRASHVAPVQVATSVPPRTQYTLYGGLSSGVGSMPDTRSIFFQSGSRDISQQPSSIETLQTIDEPINDEEETTLRSGSDPSFSPGSTIRADSSIGARPLHAFDMFGVRDAPQPFGARDTPAPFSITFGEPRNSSQPRFNIF